MLGTWEPAADAGTVPCSWCLIVSVKWLGKFLGTTPRGSNRESGLDHQESRHCCLAHFGDGVGTMQRDGMQELGQHSRPVPELWTVRDGVSANATQAGVILPLEVVRGSQHHLHASVNPEKRADSQKGHKAVNIMNSS